jgi:geranyl-CoA carboxylase alpha subunit
MRLIDSLMIANRGEIVVRVARTARRMGLHTVAVASDADLAAPHGASCDRVMPIGGERPADSYLRTDKLLAAARASGARAIHPGYGFLSENAAFAQAVIDAGFVWIGPPPEAMRAMGDKARARQRMAASGVPVLPGYDGEDQTRETLRRAAHTIGWPLMVKATAGGGGRGMRLVTQPEQLDAALDSAQAEAQAAFGEPRLLLERALVGPRHVEIQVFADAHGNVVHLGERDCSVQRRHQKIVEEAPSPAVSPELRRRMGAAAVTVARTVGYVGAGTVEFLLEADGAFWFMEMNTRLQVEHPLTEALVGIDLVEWQLRVAAGEALPFQQDELLQRYERGGHAVEVRLCAEDPARDFLPQAGTVQRWRAPATVRCDHALASSCTVSPFYDSMLGKLIAHAPTRDAAICQLAHALDHTVCLGLPSNRRFLSRVLRHSAFVQGGVTTAFIANHFGDAATRAEPAPAWLEALAATAVAVLPAQPLPMLWHGWTSSGRIDTSAPIELAGSTRRWRIEGSGADLTATAASGVTHRIEALRRHGDGDTLTVSASVDGRPVSADVHRQGMRWWWLCDGIELELTDLRLAGAGSSAQASAGALRAPMHGRVTQVLAVAGAPVEAGTLLLVMEAMKMEHQIHAPHAGTVKTVLARAGEQVAARQLLMELGP